jgi:hypothetical protein
MEITRDRKNRSIKLTQSKYIKAMLKRFNKEHLNPTSTPSEPGIKLDKNKNQATAKEIKDY